MKQKKYFTFCSWEELVSLNFLGKILKTFYIISKTQCSLMRKLRSFMNLVDSRRSMVFFILSSNCFYFSLIPFFNITFLKNYQFMWELNVSSTLILENEGSQNPHCFFSDSELFKIYFSVRSQILKSLHAKASFFWYI